MLWGQDLDMMESMNMWFSISFCLSSSLFSLIQDVRCANTVSTPAELAGVMWCLQGLSQKEVKRRTQAQRTTKSYPNWVPLSSSKMNIVTMMIYLWIRQRKTNCPDLSCMYEPFGASQSPPWNSIRISSVAGRRGEASLSFNGWVHWNVGLFLHVDI